MIDKHYRCLVVDPPWDQGKTSKRRVRPNQDIALGYPTMTQEEIAKIPVDKWAFENSFIWLWVTNSRSCSSGRPIIVQGFDLLEHWGFRYYTLLTWNKVTGVCPFGPYQIVTEHILFGFRGKCKFPRESWGKLKTSFFSVSGNHSEKPSLLYASIREYFEGPRLDVFARRRYLGFDAWGDEVEGMEPPKAVQPNPRRKVSLNLFSGNKHG